MGQQYEIHLSESQPFFKVGRKAENNISIANDQHLSNLHARFYLMNDTVHIEDITSTNG